MGRDNDSHLIQRWRPKKGVNFFRRENKVQMIFFIHPLLSSASSIEFSNSIGDVFRGADEVCNLAFAIENRRNTVLIPKC